MSEWQVTLTFDGELGEEALVALDRALEDADATVAAAPHRQFSVALPVHTTRPTDAVRHACKVVMYALSEMELPEHLIGVEALTAVEYERRAWQPTVPDIVGPIEAGEVLGVSRQRVHQLASENPRFPAPVIVTKSGSLWARTAIEAFNRGWTRKPGRPTKVPKL
jgi:predicted DNA-binding transcriptional regulator AlpA